MYESNELWPLCAPDKEHELFSFLMVYADALPKCFSSQAHLDGDWLFEFQLKLVEIASHASHETFTDPSPPHPVHWKHTVSHPVQPMDERMQFIGLHSSFCLVIRSDSIPFTSSSSQRHNQHAIHINSSHLHFQCLQCPCHAETELSSFSPIS